MYYLKEKPTLLYIVKSIKGQWVVTPYLQDIENSKLMYQEVTKDPVPAQDAAWSIKIGNSVRSVPDISLTRTQAKEGIDLALILFLSVSVLVSLAMIVVSVVCFKKKKVSVEEPTVDMNMYQIRADPEGCSDLCQ